MGATQSCGIVVMNKSTVPLNIGLSMQATQYYENNVKGNQIFYRWPGAVWETVYVYARDPSGKHDITDGQVAKEIVLATVLGGVAGVGVAIAAGLTVATFGAALTPAAIALAPLTTVGGAAGLVAETAGVAAISSGSALLSTYGAYKTTESAMEDLGLAFKKSNLYCEKKGNYAGGSGTWLIAEGGPYLDEHGKFQPRDLSIREVTQEEEFKEGNFTKVSHGKFHTEKGLQCTKNCPFKHE